MPPSTAAAARGALTRKLKQEALRLGFEAAGVTALRDSDHAAFYVAWLDAGYHGDMAYLARPDAVRRRLHPGAAHPELRSAVVVALRYAEGTDATGDANAPAAGGRAHATDDAVDASRGIIARYARGRDYHRVVKSKLIALLRFLETEVGHALPAARASVDTAPVLERELARRAGLGWFGRNTMLLHPRRGSYFFLGTLLVELELEADAPFEADHCGRCNACVEACPTGALLGRNAEGAPIIDARRCISYLTIEQRGPIPRELRPLIGNRIFGCDICQEVCPWNGPKLVQITGEKGFPARPSTTAPSLAALMRMTREEWDLWTRGSAIRRAGYAGLKRNVAVALGNAGERGALVVLRKALDDEEPLVREHAAWAIEEIEGRAAAARPSRSS